LKYASLDAADYMGKTLLWCGSVMGKCHSAQRKSLAGEMRASKRVRREM